METIGTLHDKPEQKHLWPLAIGSLRPADLVDITVFPIFVDAVVPGMSTLVADRRGETEAGTSSGKVEKSDTI